MTPVHAAVTTVKVVKVARGFPLLRTLAVVVLSAYVLWTYWIVPKIDSMTPWEGLAPSVPDMTPWDGVIPGSYGCPTAPVPVQPAASGFPALLHDVGAGLRSVASGPPSSDEIKAWFGETGASGAAALHYVKGGLDGEARPLGLAPVPPAPAVRTVAAPSCPSTGGGMVAVAGGQSLRADVAPAYQAMASAFQATFGKPLMLTSGYRSTAQQARLYSEHRARGSNLAAPPGKSNHEQGIAVDLGSGVNRFGTPEHEWMRANAGRFGFHHPGWAQRSGSKPEAWHWEYIGAGTPAG